MWYCLVADADVTDATITRDAGCRMRGSLCVGLDSLAAVLILRVVNLDSVHIGVCEECTCNSPRFELGSYVIGENVRTACIKCRDVVPIPFCHVHVLSLGWSVWHASSIRDAMLQCQLKIWAILMRSKALQVSAWITTPARGRSPARMRLMASHGHSTV